MQTSRAEHWGTLISTSHYQALVEIRSALTQNNVSDAMQGLNEYIETLARQDLHACLSHIINIMLHVLKWKQQPEKRSRSWLLSIETAATKLKIFVNSYPVSPKPFCKENGQDVSKELKRTPPCKWV
jgi:hypothetical protein